MFLLLVADSVVLMISVNADNIKSLSVVVPDHTVVSKGEENGILYIPDLDMVVV